jgi:predicted DNA-binding transcriptional regulator AlpA
MTANKYRANPPIVRAALKQSEDGLSTKEMAEMTGISQNALYRVLDAMPDTYIDRWTFPHGIGHPTAIWCVVDVPENCPKPSRRKVKE